MSQQAFQFHPSEVAIQQRLGVAERVARSTKGFIRPYLPDQHREFYAQLRFIILAAVDAHGFPWPIPMFGRRGFVSSPEPLELMIAGNFALPQLLGPKLEPGSKVGLIGIDFVTRRRNRINGYVLASDDTGISVHVDQSFGNCPKYIQQRNVSDDRRIEQPQGQLHLKSAIDNVSKALIERADTFFIGSRTACFNDNWHTGVDASHRGGEAGFVSVAGNRLVFPDYSGNRFFNTLGNIEDDGRVGLIFIDFNSGDACLVVGKASINWQQDDIDAFNADNSGPKAERLIDVTISKLTYLRRLMPTASCNHDK
ncbi:hypothetical protein GCM10011369_27450 [Neiella marina]|uniref:Pyridoxamine 5'-phosphate oxidase putative domain-containing protein n=1 Tax=Neiella marina TaxID=508461 RepID=A0A8J2U7C5_9GAMM|nr:pyridoxamine 5'-phosphate oxidase family protein [Neiella marina]GGA83951.1 hypothetical protein GCM10011369_27450 [Neiella marina]